MHPQSLRAAWMALAGLSAVFLFEMLDNSILNVALPTIGRELHATTTGLQWVTSAYSVVFGGLMLLFGTIADRYGRRRIMLLGLVLLALASLATAFVVTAEQLTLVRAVMGIAAAMTTPLSMALAFRLFDDEKLRIRGITLISTAGLVGLAIGPTLGGLILAVAPWQVLLLVNVPIAALAFLGIQGGIPRDDPADLHRDPVDVAGAILGTLTIVLALVAPTLFVTSGVGSPVPWVTTAGAVLAAAAFGLREHTARYPLLDLKLIAVPLVSSGLAFKAATGLATAGLGYLVTLQLQLDWGWPPALAALGMLPQVVVLLAAGPFVSRFVDRVGISAAAWTSSAAVVVGLGVFALLGRYGYVGVAVPLALVAAGLRIIGVVAGVSVLTGLPKTRSSIGAALVDTATEVSSGVGVAVAGTILAALITGSITAPDWSADKTAQFEAAVTLSGLVLTGIAAALVVWGFVRSRARTAAPDTLPSCPPAEPSVTTSGPAEN